MSDLDRYLTDAMVEAAAKARWDYDCAESGDTTEWDMRYPSFREFDIDAMRAALEAVVPDIIQQAKAEAWDEGRSMSELTWRHIYDGHDEPGVEVVTKEARR